MNLIGAAGVDRLQLEVELFRVRERGRHKDAAERSLETRHTYVQQVQILQPIIKRGREKMRGFWGQARWLSVCLSFPPRIGCTPKQPTCDSEFLRTAHQHTSQFQSILK